MLCGDFELQKTLLPFFCTWITEWIIHVFSMYFF
ncbi:hypothetical protein NC652_028905 [Populus alba x Populus x berolinensis]|uniref:Uncharacterized protein n=1 Tax=Populus alba x Populus x berolinensis TaxID=444605 RepID=A0AAD6Q3M9_9ROSI|nr:hypothetical protein NC652_028905 [Populus alba x Populus x berolinensis]KAJ6976580.1 hypothetical protein NC653_028667 [Populus alba x Populus x berolinensis]